MLTARKLNKAYHSLVQLYLSKGKINEAKRLAVALQTVSKIPEANQLLAKIIRETEK